VASFNAFHSAVEESSKACELLSFHLAKPRQGCSFLLNLVQHTLKCFGLAKFYENNNMGSYLQFFELASVFGLASPFVYALHSRGF
jgi:hypothetical protein